MKRFKAHTLNLDIGELKEKKSFQKKRMKSAAVKSLVIPSHFNDTDTRKLNINMLQDIDSMGWL